MRVAITVIALVKPSAALLCLVCGDIETPYPAQLPITRRALPPIWAGSFSGLISPYLVLSELAFWLPEHVSRQLFQYVSKQSISLVVANVYQF